MTWLQGGYVGAYCSEVVGQVEIEFHRICCSVTLPGCGKNELFADAEGCQVCP